MDADKNPAEDVTSLAALDIEDILSKTSFVSRGGVLFNVHQSMLKEQGPASLGFFQRAECRSYYWVTTQIDLDLVLSLTSAKRFQQTLPTVGILI